MPVRLVPRTDPCEWPPMTASTAPAPSESTSAKISPPQVS